MIKGKRQTHTQTLKREINREEGVVTTFLITTKKKSLIVASSSSSSLGVGSCLNIGWMKIHICGRYDSTHTQIVEILSLTV
jgi:hypothetical protein